MYNKKMQQIIATKKVNKQKILTIFRKFIKLNLENYKVIKNLIIKVKDLKRNIYISK